MLPILERYAYTPIATLGRLLIGDVTLWTIEQPWVSAETPGGMPFKSCIPDGKYRLIPYTRQSPGHEGELALCYVNESLGVYFGKADRPNQVGRYKCLWHPGNYVRHVKGCTAIGAESIIYQGEHMVTASRKTFGLLRELIDFNQEHEIIIRRTAGAIDH